MLRIVPMHNPRGTLEEKYLDKREAKLTNRALSLSRRALCRECCVKRISRKRIRLHN
jgi:hypothetical protein